MEWIIQAFHRKITIVFQRKEEKKMFCGKCGSKIDDNAKFCPKCGASISNGNTEIVSVRQVSMKGNKENRKIKLFGLAVTVIVVAFFLLFNSGGPEKVAIKSCKTTINGDMKAYYKLLAPSYQDYMVGSQGWYRTEEEFQNDLANMAKDKQREIISKCGENYKVEYEVIDIEKADKEKLQFVKSELKNYYYYDPNKIKAAAVVTVSISASGSEGVGYWTTEVSCVKIGSSWYVHRPGIDAM